ncbi:UDPglucose--hexose-1-phosphate uridylyltransferase [Staphylococcus auricularis]|uniref:Galactose-1-phosphate uridylyltransferase n=1 Tax=Staphylococcus auricularis TaxID=29379 RepID=A0AAP8PQU6_9STAP|nr:UDP-glucose--hexose-1-phosphate uridylyltransferase [Staphylococcus auricularis]MBM0867321.1 UDP-glucose--hexose-1-phosphate uridylyltransferase [Staphylococcus auricularis]PNZ68018.1 UDP-glucose--hexose-1-phosphate uridylyltransferase [Staphylococcus auricularis]QPT06594.1 UDP-glucose--hexose-1-phosphate uridylyltransferase [Staphylococcus auricularis]SQJ15050.1 galactose-1-phosphate uridylyltransferase [Staphylococcus auricularis]BCU52981.1 galactose-1-phosphate uridylyltransferase [Staph
MLLNQNELDQFIEAIIYHTQYEYEDAIYLQNQIIRIVGASGVTNEEALEAEAHTPIELVLHWIEQGVEAGTITDTTASKEIVEAQLMDLMTPPPSEVNNHFRQLYAKDPEAATDYFYALSKRSHYVKEDAIARNINYEVPTTYGDLEITINLSKPEKSAKDIEAARNATQIDYPQSALSKENEGYVGSETQAARTNHRIIRIQLDGERWGFQYSPYAYFEEHSIVLATEHVPMQINRQTFINLLDFIDQFPHYFIGSNSDIPLVGGSIMSHNHYQSGRHTFPMDNAKELETIQLKGFSDIEATRLYWPMSVIRLRSSDKHRLIDAATYVMDCWNQYSDRTVDINAYSEDGERHHTITPITRFRNQQYEIDIVLRDNQTSEQYPDGIFHPHQDVQHIKKENIGLIEVMGRAILPGRLKQELQDVEQYLLGQYEGDLGKHQSWADEMLDAYDITEENVEHIVHKEVGYKFTRVLEDAGVFKNDEQGQQAFQRFIATL